MAAIIDESISMRVQIKVLQAEAAALNGNPVYQDKLALLVMRIAQLEAELKAYLARLMAKLQERPLLPPMKVILEKPPEEKPQRPILLKLPLKLVAKLLLPPKVTVKAREELPSRPSIKLAPRPVAAREAPVNDNLVISPRRVAMSKTNPVLIQAKAPEISRPATVDLGISKSQVPAVLGAQRRASAFGGKDSALLPPLALDKSAPQVGAPKSVGAFGRGAPGLGLAPAAPAMAGGGGRR